MKAMTKQAALPTLAGLLNGVGDYLVAKMSNFAPLLLKPAATTLARGYPASGIALFLLSVPPPSLHGKSTLFNFNPTPHFILPVIYVFL
jgi:hypothetical protein